MYFTTPPGRSRPTTNFRSMRIGFLVTDLGLKKANHATIRLAREATNRGHEVWLMSPGDFAFDADDSLWMRARKAPRSNYKNSSTYLSELVEKPVEQRVAARELDVLMLRDNPARHSKQDSWARPSGVTFGRAALEEGVVVLNDPNGLSQANNKMYFQFFPEAVRPRTMITRSRSEIRDFAGTLEGDLILKPLQGSGGENVFLVKKDANYNLNQLVDSVSKDGYVVAQEYLPEAHVGDVRMFVMNGKPLRYKGKYAVVQRLRQGEDIRSNIHAGGAEAKAEVTPEMLQVAEMVAPKLVKDGMFLVGLDIVGNKLMEINVFCPGGLNAATRLEGVNFAAAVIDAVERKARYAEYCNRRFDNITLATL